MTHSGWEYFFGIVFVIKLISSLLGDERKKPENLFGSQKLNKSNIKYKNYDDPYFYKNSIPEISPKIELEIIEDEKIKNKFIIQNQAQELAKAELARIIKLYVPTLDELRGLTSQAFEDAMASLFGRLGYKVEQTPYTNDHGRDAIMYIDGKKILLECKKYNEKGVSGREQLQKFHSAIIFDKADSGFFVTTGTVTEGASQFAKKVSIEIIHGAMILDLYRKAIGTASEDLAYKAACKICGSIVKHSVGSYDEIECSNGHKVEPTINLTDLQSGVFHSNIQSKKCPKCSAPMRLIKGRKGQFWGCTWWPKCHSSLSVNNK